jgi:hypothetical protein
MNTYEITETSIKDLLKDALLIGNISEEEYNNVQIVIGDNQDDLAKLIKSISGLFDLNLN